MELKLKGGGWGMHFKEEDEGGRGGRRMMEMEWEIIWAEMIMIKAKT